MQELTLTSQIPAQADPEIVILPSEGLERARPKISITHFVVEPGPAIEALMRSAAFIATQHQYDI